MGICDGHIEAWGKTYLCQVSAHLVDEGISIYWPFFVDTATHKVSLDDVRMNLEVVRNSWVSPNAITRSRTNGNSSGERTGHNTSALSLSVKVENHLASSPPTQRMEENHQTLLLTAHNTGELVEVDPENAGPFNMGVFNDIVGKEPLPDACNRHTDFFEPCDISIRFGISTKFVDHAGRPGLNIVVNALPSLCKILDESDGLAQKLSMDSGSHSEWRPVVSRKAGFFNCPTVRFHFSFQNCKFQSLNWNRRLTNKMEISSVVQLKYIRKTLRPCRGLCLVVLILLS